MKIVPEHLHRYKEIVKLLWKYGRSDLVKDMDLDPAIREEARPANGSHVTPEMLADDLEALGPTYVKLGQVLASRPDLLPEAYCKGLARLQDDVKPFAFEQVQATVEAELRVRLSKAFARFDREPLAAASLGQVHAAALRDGTEVVVKVQRPEVRKQVTQDFEVLMQMAGFTQAHTGIGRRHHVAEIVAELRTSIMNELDYRKEAQNLAAMAANLREFELIRIPRPIQDYSNERVLTMERIPGTKITQVSPLARMEIDGAALADELFRAYLKQVLVDGLFHADPHPGNVFVTEDGRIALLDLGMVGHTTPGMQVNLLKVLLAVSEGKSEQAAEVLMGMSPREDGFDATLFRRRLGQVIAAEQGKQLRDINVGRTMLDVTRAAVQVGLHVPTELAMLSKTLLQLDEIATLLHPGFDPNAAVRRDVSRIMSKRVLRDATQGSVLSTMLDMEEFISGLPVRVNKVMDAVGNRELEVKVRAVDASYLMEGAQKIANRITAGVILAALIVGAALLMQVDTTFRILGYPGIAILLFLAAAAGGVWLLVSIFAHDRRP